MKKIDITILSTLSLLLLITIACDDTITGEEIDNIEIPGRNVSYQEYIEPVLQIKCANRACHDAISGAGGIVLVTHTHVTRDASIVFLTTLRTVDLFGQLRVKQVQLCLH